MRLLDRNKQTIYYANYSSKTENVDEYGNATGTYSYTYGTPTALKCYVSPQNGEATREFYGIADKYSRVLIMKSCPFTVNSRLWIDNPTTSPYDYEVSQIATSLNQVQVLVRKVD